MDHLNAAEIGYIYGNHSTNKLTIALMIQIASKGYIKIDELKKKKIQITNLCCPPKEGKSFDEKVSDELVKGKYIQIVSDNKESRYEDLEKQRKEYEEENKEFQEQWEVYQKQKSLLKPLSELEEIVYNQLFVKDNVIIVSEHKTLYKAFQKVEKN